jgi:RNA polymerase sigma-70 factor, ECF subfamily
MRTTVHRNGAGRHQSEEHQSAPWASQALRNTTASTVIAGLAPGLRRWGRGRLPRWARTAADTIDLVQDVVASSLQRARANPERSVVWEAYLREAFTNRVRDEVRRAVRRPRAGASAALAQRDVRPSPLDAVVSTQHRERYARALASLSPRDRAVLLARMEGGLSYEEIARLTGKPTAAAALMAVRRAVARLTAHVASHDDRSR